MLEPIIYVDRSEIRDGKFEELRAAMNDLVDFVDANEPRLIAYNVYFDEDRTGMTVIHIHSDSASLEFHMRVAGGEFARFADLVRIVSIDVYGRPSDELVERLEGKAEMLGNGTVRVHGLHAGVARLPAI